MRGQPFLLVRGRGVVMGQDGRMGLRGLRG